jgi:adenylate cyclase
MTKIVYENEKVVEEDDLSLTLLEISLKHGIPHAHECGGNARCSTCRVIILESLYNVLPRNQLEQKLAKQKGLEANIRLACQTKIKGTVKLRRLTRDDIDIQLVAGNKRSTGTEIQAAVLFCDIRDFTAFAESHLPYDTIHILNHYFYHIGEAILKCHGYIDKYMGDGVMALFGLPDDQSFADARTICFDAVSAGLAILEALKRFNQRLKNDFNTEFRIGIGIHFGNVLVGEMGHPKIMQYTAIGDTVNTASRIESATKTAQTSLLISEAVLQHIRDKFQIGKTVNLELKGKTGKYTLYEVLQ